SLFETMKINRNICYSSSTLLSHRFKECGVHPAAKSHWRFLIRSYVQPFMFHNVESKRQRLKSQPVAITPAGFPNKSRSKSSSLTLYFNILHLIFEESTQVTKSYTFHSHQYFS